MKSSPLANLGSAPFAWQQQQWQHLYQLHLANRLAHALLFTGQAGVGKYLFALSFAKTLLCRSVLTAGIACQQCRDCLLVAANSHPDLHGMVPDKVGKGIKIEQVRQCIQQSQQTTQSPYKIIIINPAESLLVAASHALLKNLEEPTARTLFILITDKPGLLLATIRSRCQLIRFHPPQETVGKRWLQAQIPNFAAFDELYALADGAVLQALAYAQTGVFTVYQELLTALLQLLQKKIDPIKLAENYLKTELATVLHCLVKIVSELIKCHFSLSDKNQRSHLQLLANKVTLSFLFHYLDQLTNYQKHIKIALNQQLLLEDLFCRWFLQGTT
jgi:DNA polymerase III subunit delta'